MYFLFVPAMYGHSDQWTVGTLSQCTDCFPFVLFPCMLSSSLHMLFCTSVRGVARGKYMWKHGSRSGQDRFVIQLCPGSWVFGGRCKPPAGGGPGQSLGSKRIFGNNLLKIG